MKTKRTTIILLLMGFLFAFPIEQANAQFTGKIRNIRIKKRRTGSGFKIYANISGGTESSTVKVDMAPSSKESPKPLVGSFSLKVTSKDDKGIFTAEKDFACIKDDCLFSKEVAETGDKYKVTTTVLDKNGKAISKTKTSEVSVEIDDSECEGRYFMRSITYSGLDYYSPSSEANSSDYSLFIKTKGSTSQTISVPVSRYRRGKYTKIGNLCILSGKIRVSGWSNSGPTVTTINAIFNEKTQSLEANWPGSDTFFMVDLEVQTILYNRKVILHNHKQRGDGGGRILRVQGNEIEFKLKKSKESNKEGNDSNFSAPLNLSTEITLDSDIRGSFQVLTIDDVKITQKDKPLSNLEVEAIVEMKNCKGATIYVAIPLKYNEKAGTYMNSKALALCNKTGMTIQAIDVQAKGKDLPLYKWTHVAFTHRN